MTGAELIARLKLDGGTAFVSGLRTAGAEISSLGNKAIQTGEKLTRGLITPILALAGGLGAASLISLGKDAITASADFEQLSVTMEVLTKNADLAKEKLSFIQKLALPSTFTFSQLAQSGVQLESFGLRVEKILPLVAKLGGAFKSDTEHLMMLTRMFGGLAQGKFPDIEQLSAFGLSRKQFEQKGVKFDGQGALKSSAIETLNALSAIINDKYGSILDRMQNTTNSKLASLQDNWERLLRGVGDLLVKYLNPAMEFLTRTLDNLANGKKLETWANGLVKTFSTLIGILQIATALLAGLVAAAVLNGFVNFCIK